MVEWPNLDELEERIKAKIISTEKGVIGVIEALLNQYLAGFRQIGSFTLTDENHPQQVWLLLTNRAFNSLRWSFHLLQTGYYSQSMMLTRAGFEDWLVCEDSKGHPETIDALLNRAGRIPSVSDMAARLEEPLFKEWRGVVGDDGIYGLLSTFTHPRYRAVAVMVDPETQNLRLGPSWDEDLFIVTANYLLLALIRMMESLIRPVPQDTEWLADLKPFMDRSHQCREILMSRAKIRLETEGGPIH